MATQEPQEEKRSQTRRVFAWLSQHPLLSFLGFVVGVMSLAVSIVFFYLSQKERDIRYAVSASPTTVVRAGQSSDLRVSFKEKQLTSDVSSLQIELWSYGKEAIKQSNILSGVVLLKFDPPTQILESRIKKQTRDLIDFKIDNSAIASGELRCSWGIMEYKDAVLLEVIYVGSSERVVASGAIEGQTPIRRVLVKNESDPAFSGQFRSVIGFGLLFGFLRAVVHYRSERRSSDSRLRSAISALAGGALWGILAFQLALLSVGFYVTWVAPTPPFPI